MSITVECDYCAKPILEVVYVVVVTGVSNVDDPIAHSIRRSHLHWKCLKLFADMPVLKYTGNEK